MGSPLALVKVMALPSKELPEQALDALITRERTRVMAPLTEWRTLSASLRQEGLIQGSGDASAAYGSAGQQRTADPYIDTDSGRGGGWLRATGRWSVRVVTGAALVGIGVVAGRGMTFGQDLINQIQVVVSDSTGSGHRSVRLGDKPFTSSRDARATMLRAQTDYQRAAAFLAASDTSPHVVGEPLMYRSRLAGLDEMTAASLGALKDAPKDPVLNQYYLSAAAARAATLQQLDNSLPVGTTMVSF